MTPEEIKGKWKEIEPQLKAGDILMVHTRQNWISKRIRKTAKTYWNHTALVFMGKQFLPVGGPLIVEADFGGIKIHQMKKYADNFDKYDLGVLRYPELTEEQREEIVMGFILSNLDTTYDYTRLVGWFFGPLVRRISTRLWGKLFRGLMDQQKFVCTTFVHKAFHELSAHKQVSGYVHTHDEETRGLEGEELISPGDIAKEPIFEWVFNQHD